MGCVAHCMGGRGFSAVSSPSLGDAFVLRSSPSSHLRLPCLFLNLALKIRFCSDLVCQNWRTFHKQAVLLQVQKAPQCPTATPSIIEGTPTIVPVSLALSSCLRQAQALERLDANNCFIIAPKTGPKKVVKTWLR